MNIIFLGMPYPVNDIDEQDPYCHVTKVGSIAQINLLRGLKKDKNNNLSIIAASLGEKRRTLDLGHNLSAQPVPSFHTKNFGLFLLSLIPTNTIALLRSIRTAKKHTPNGQLIIITLNTTLPFSLPVLLARLFYKELIWCPYLVDSVEYPHYESIPFKVANKFSVWAARQADASITLNVPNAVDYIPGKPFLELFFSVSDEDMKLYRNHKPKKNKKFTIAYIGALTDIYNFHAILKTIQETGKKYCWVFAGYGPNQDEINKLSLDKRYDVKYLGTVSHIESIKLQKSADLLLCLRLSGGSPLSQYSARYAASGKLSEYLCSGTPILAGDIPAFSDQIKRFMTTTGDPSARSIQYEIENIVKSYDHKLRVAEEGREFAARTFNTTEQGHEVNKFLRNIIKTDK